MTYNVFGGTLSLTQPWSATPHFWTKKTCSRCLVVDSIITVANFTVDKPPPKIFVVKPSANPCGEVWCCLV